MEKKKDIQLEPADEGRVEEAMALLREMEAVDRARGYDRVVRPVLERWRRERWWRWIAACAAVMVGLVVVMYRGEEKGKAVEVAVVDSIVPGRTMAKLVLGSGCEVLLDTVKGERLVVAEGVMARREGRGLAYEAGTGGNTEMEWNELVVPRGGEYDVVLEDGTRVWLNADSRLRYPVVFGSGERRVWLEGEGYFDVARDSMRPFVVEAGEQQVRVLGTAFDVSAYEGERLHYTVLERGRVAVENRRTGEERVLRPGQQVMQDVETGRVTVREVEVGRLVAWREGMFVFDGLTLEQIMGTLGRWYNVEVFYANEKAKELVFRGNLPRYSDFRVVLSVLEKTSNVRFGVRGRTVTVNL